MIVRDDVVLGGEATAEAPRPRRIGIVVAILLPPLALVSGWLAGKLGAWPREVVPGGSTWLPLSAIWLLAIPVALFCSFVLAFAAAGKGIPASLPVLFAGGPWLIGVALAAVAQMHIAQALTIEGGGVGVAAAGLAEAALMRLAGELPSAALLCAVGIALAVAALCQPDDGREAERGEGSAPPRLRRAALASAAPVAAGLGLVAAALAYRDRVLVETLQSAALLGRALTAAANAEIAAASRFAEVAGGLAPILIPAMAALPYLRTRPHTPRWRDSAPLAAVAVFVVVPALLLGTPNALLEWASKTPQRAPASPEGKLEGAWAPAPSSGGEAPVDARRIGGDVQSPRAITRVQPVYPLRARLTGTQGVVIVEAVIDEHGGVSHVRVLKGLPNGLDGAAVDAVKQWKFAPATLHGRPVAVYFTLTVNFKIDSQAKPD